MKNTIGMAVLWAFGAGLLVGIITHFLPSGTYWDGNAMVQIVIGAAVIGSVVGGVDAIITEIQKLRRPDE